MLYGAHLVGVTLLAVGHLMPLQGPAALLDRDGRPRDLRIDEEVPGENGREQLDRAGQVLTVHSHEGTLEDVFMSLTGSTANFGISSVNGIKMAADEINAAGGILGRRLELIVEQGRVIGAFGYRRESGEFLLFETPAVVLAATS